MWIGDRTRQLDGGHVECCRGIENPIGIKCGPTSDPEEIVKICNVINPKNEKGKSTLISRFGHDKVEKYLPKLIRKIKTLKLPLVVCRSKSGGAHVFLFSEDFVEAKTMRDKLNQIRAVLGFGSAEVFPKQIELKSEEDTGNFLNLPYFNHEVSTRYAFKDDGSAATIEEFYGIYNNVKQLDVGSIKVQRPDSEFSDGPST